MPVTPQRRSEDLWWPEVWKRIAKLEAKMEQLHHAIKPQRALIYGLYALIVVDILLGHRSDLGDKALGDALESIAAFFGSLGSFIPP